LSTQFVSIIFTPVVGGGRSSLRTRLAKAATARRGDGEEVAALGASEYDQFPIDFCKKMILRDVLGSPHPSLHCSNGEPSVSFVADVE
jgi:hypothetical protein